MQIDKIKISEIKGFLDEEEADCLYQLALGAGQTGHCLEIGSYCGKSAVYLGNACRENGVLLFSIDHHCGSEEQQEGQAYFDPSLIDEETGRIDTLRFFRKTISDFKLDDVVIPIIGRSEIVGAAWQTSLNLIFIDGSHAYEAVLRDYEIWSRHLVAGGYLLFHDIFLNPAEGGQAPYLVYQKALSSGLYDVLPMCKSLGILKRKNIKNSPVSNR